MFKRIKDNSKSTSLILWSPFWETKVVNTLNLVLRTVLNKKETTS